MNSGGETTKSVTESKPGWKRKKKSKEKNSLQKFVRTYSLELSLVALVLLAIFLFINPLPQIDVLFDKLPFGLHGRIWKISNWLAYKGGAKLIGSAFVAIVAVLGYIRTRQRIVYNRQLWSLRCPTCQVEGLKRTRRTNADKLLTAIGFPVKRCRCSNCQWEGLRIDESRV